VDLLDLTPRTDKTWPDSNSFLVSSRNTGPFKEGKIDDDYSLEESLWPDEGNNSNDNNNNNNSNSNNSNNNNNDNSNSNSGSSDEQEVEEEQEAEGEREEEEEEEEEEDTWEECFTDSGDLFWYNSKKGERVALGPPGTAPKHKRDVVGKESKEIEISEPFNLKHVPVGLAAHKHPPDEEDSTKRKAEELEAKIEANKDKGGVSHPFNTRHVSYDRMSLQPPGEEREELYISETKHNFRLSSSSDNNNNNNHKRSRRSREWFNKKGEKVKISSPSNFRRSTPSLDDFLRDSRAEEEVWSKFMTTDGTPYWFNGETKESTWEDPSLCNSNNNSNNSSSNNNNVYVSRPFNFQKQISISSASRVRRRSSKKVPLGQLKGESKSMESLYVSGMASSSQCSVVQFLFLLDQRRFEIRPTSGGAKKETGRNSLACS